jgi:hypothetical protein
MDEPKAVSNPFECSPPHSEVTITWRLIRMKLPRRRPRYADVAATLALVMAMGGTAYAVTQIDPDSVYTGAIQDKAVTQPKLHNNSVNSAKVVDGSIGSVDIADNSITSADLGTDSVQAIQIADNSIDGGEIIDNSLGAADLAAGSVGNSELASNAVTGDKVASNSISLADLVGADVKGAISFSLGANTCGTLNFGVSGAAVGEVVLMSYTGSVAVPPAVVFGVARVTAAGSISQRACNVSSTAVSVSSIGVRIITFG